jgi:hypothetical protein
MRQEIEMKSRGSQIPDNTPSTSPTDTESANLKAGDLVQIRSREEIESSLDDQDSLRGCLLMSEMWAYCGTAQRILKPVKRILDERDYRVKKCTGIFLLEGVICQGSAFPEGCDCSCFIFWREEWLKKIDTQEI